MQKEKRFEILSIESIGAMRGAMILRDKQTSVQYLFVESGSAGGLAPLLDKDGKPVIDKLAE